MTLRLTRRSYTMLYHIGCLESGKQGDQIRLSELFGAERGHQWGSSTDGQCLLNTGQGCIGETTHVIVISIDYTGRRVDLESLK